MILVILLFAGMAVFDAWFTASRIPQLGIEAEYNLFIRWLSRKYGIKAGVWVGVLLPTLCLIGVGAWGFTFLVYLLGCRTTLFAFQLKQVLGRK